MYNNEKKVADRTWYKAYRPSSRPVYHAMHQLFGIHTDDDSDFEIDDEHFYPTKTVREGTYDYARECVTTTNAEQAYVVLAPHNKDTRQKDTNKSCQIIGKKEFFETVYTHLKTRIFTFNQGNAYSYR